MKKLRMQLILVFSLIVPFFMIDCIASDSAKKDDEQPVDNSPQICPDAHTEGSSIGSLHSGFPGVELVWNDEFDGTEISNKWKYDNDSEGNRVGWGNGEAQYYTDSTGDNAYINHGSLVIEAQAESFGGKSFTSARLHTHGTYKVQYGVIEARIKMPENASGETDVATFPAFWMLGENFNGWGHGNFGGTVAWPASGEIDVVESNQVGNGYGKVLGTIHYDWGGGHRYEGGNTAISNATSEYHVYAMKWTSTQLEYYLDGTKYQTIDISPAEKSELTEPFFLLLNLAVGGPGTGFTGGQVADTSKYPQIMCIDYVRVYK